jgi:TolA-binding protein
MSKSKSDKRTIWVYAVILFTSAFVVLLLTAYSQIKFNKNIDEYKNRISNEEQQKVNFKTDLSSSISENKKLKTNNDALSIENSKLKSDIDKLKDDVANAKKSDKTDKYEALLIAVNLYENGDTEGCAEMLYSLNYSEDMLGEQGFKKYKEMEDKTFKPAAEKIYFEAYRDYYLKKQYPSAIKSFRLSLNLANSEYFSDDCLFLLANAELNNGDSENAKSDLNKLIDNYKDSNYYKDAQNLLGELESISN